MRLRIGWSVAQDAAAGTRLGPKMVDVSRRKTRNVILVPTEHIAIVAELKERIGPRQAAKELGFGRDALLGILANGEAAPGTVSLLRAALVKRGTL
jgi:hypothetical protein